MYATNARTSYLPGYPRSEAQLFTIFMSFIAKFVCINSWKFVNYLYAEISCRKFAPFPYFQMTVYNLENLHFSKSRLFFIWKTFNFLLYLILLQKLDMTVSNYIITLYCYQTCRTLSQRTVFTPLFSFFLSQLNLLTEYWVNFIIFICRVPHCVHKLV